MVVVGASLAGLRAAQAARKAGFDGRLTLVGGEARVPYDRPPLSKAYLDAEPAEPKDTTFHAEEELREDLRLDARLATWAMRLDTERRVLSVDGRDGAGELGYDVLVIASGASPRPLAVEGADLAGVHTLRTLDDARAIRAALDNRPRTVVIGAGFIGSEVASSVRRRGLPVTLLEVLPVPLVRSVGERAGEICARMHRDHGTDLRCGVKVTGLEGVNGAVCGVRLDDGTTVPADLVVVGVGVTPNTAWLAGSGLALHERDGGIVCDETLSAGAPGVYAAGDVAHVPHPLFGGELIRLEHWTNASEQGALAARNALDPSRATPAAGVPYFWSDWYGSRIQFVGLPTADEIRVVSEEKDEEKFLALYRRGDRLTGCMAVDRAGQVMKYQRMIAKGATWPDALEFAKVSPTPPSGVGLE
jgi:NADPH-dependent 2,4-dienoyl-CoA reductase/sulfur reductase-like enzyme